MYILLKMLFRYVKNMPVFVYLTSKICQTLNSIENLTYFSHLCFSFMCKYCIFVYLLTIRQFLGNVLPGYATLCHQDHDMIQKIGDLVFDFFRIRVLGRNDDLSSFLAHLL